MQPGLYFWCFPAQKTNSSDRKLLFIAAAEIGVKNAISETCSGTGILFSKNSIKSFIA